MKSNRLKTINKFKELVPANKLAFKYINDGVNITAEEVNNVLAFADISITQTLLTKILSSPWLVFTNLSLYTLKSPEFLEHIGTIRNEKCPAGVYI